MNEWPPTTTPSTGTRPPGRTSTTSPVRKSARLADLYAVRAPQFHLLRQQVQQILNGAAPAAHGQLLQDLGDQYEEHDQEGREYFANRQRGDQRNGHGEFHGHAPRQKIGESFVEYRVAADQDRSEPGDIQVRYRLPDAQPRRRDRQSHETDAC